FLQRERASSPARSDGPGWRRGIGLAPKHSMRRAVARARRSMPKSRKSGGRRYGAKAGEKVERALHEMKRGQLRSGRSGKKGSSREQAIAIGLSEARRAGGKVPRRRSTRKG